MLQLKSIKKNYITASETVEALRGVSLCFERGEFVSVLGPSGCGKTTLLNLIGGLDRYTEGDIAVDGVSTKEYTDRDWDSYRNHSVGFVFQSYNLIPHQSVLRNVELALTIGGVPREEREARAKAALDRVGLDGQYGKLPKELSGGQCQRVAIARALVNDPRILLLDEPTGALDAATSVQIMELVRRLASDRLVIMVTHNAELAERYCTRIIRLADGNVVSDTANIGAAEAKAGEINPTRVDISPAKDEGAPERAPRARMSFFTAFMLSLRNLLSKKGRTLLVSIAGSVGIIGIALVLAFSSGVKGYISSMQNDMMSGNPITVTETVYDLDALMGILDAEDAANIVRSPDRAYINAYLEFLLRTSDNISENLIIENRITEDYLSYLLAMNPDYYEDIALHYGIDLTPNLFTDYRSGNSTASLSLSRITDTHASILNAQGSTTLGALFSSVCPTMKELPDSREYVESQYDLLAGEYPEGVGEIVLVLDKNGAVNDMLLAKFGYYSTEDFLEIIERSRTDVGGEPETMLYSDLLGKTYTYYPTDSVFERTESDSFFGLSYKYLSCRSDISGEGLTLEVVGILSPKENIAYGAVATGMYYTRELTEWVLGSNRDSRFINEFLKDDGNLSSLKITEEIYGVPYQFAYDCEGKTSLGSGVITYAQSIEELFTGQITAMFNPPTARGLVDRLISSLGGSSRPYAITVFPSDIGNKSAVADYLNRWNSDETLTVDGREIPPEERDTVTYSDSMELVLGLIGQLVNIVSAALIAFTSVALIVSTVMIGVITYVSVVERTKEIGVIRSLGGRKRDVAALFMSETLIIGLCSGVIGTVFAYLVSLAVNPIFGSLLNYGAICALPPAEAALLILVSVALTLLSGALPSGRAARLDPAVALRAE